MPLIIFLESYCSGHRSRFAHYLKLVQLNRREIIWHINVWAQRIRRYQMILRHRALFQKVWRSVFDHGRACVVWVFIVMSLVSAMIHQLLFALGVKVLFKLLLEPLLIELVSQSYLCIFDLHVALRKVAQLWFDWPRDNSRVLLDHLFLLFLDLY
jgi:hypothetical protein